MNKYFIIVLAICLILLSIAFVVWLDPFLWFKDQVKEDAKVLPVDNGEKTTAYGVEIHEKCLVQFEDFVKDYGSDYSKCLVNFNFTEEYCGGFDPALEGTSNINVIVILDSSGSMAEVINSQRKIDVAKKAVSDFLTNVPKGVNTGLVVYGHKGSNSTGDKDLSCVGIEEVVKLGKNNNSNIISALDSFNPQGWTPIAGSLDFAKNIFINNGKNNKNYLILVSDGVESCDGDPIESSLSLKAEVPGIKLNVIGFTDDSKIRDSLEKIAIKGSGSYLNANNLADITAAFNKELLMIKRDCLYVTFFQMSLRYKANYISNLNCWLDAYNKESSNFTNNVFKKSVNAQCNLEIANALQARHSESWYKKQELEENNTIIYRKIESDFNIQLKALDNLKK